MKSKTFSIIIPSIQADQPIYPSQYLYKKKSSRSNSSSPSWMENSQMDSLINRIKNRESILKYYRFKLVDTLEFGRNVSTKRQIYRSIFVYNGLLRFKTRTNIYKSPFEGRVHWKVKEKTKETDHAKICSGRKRFVNFSKISLE